MVYFGKMDYYVEAIAELGYRLSQDVYDRGSVGPLIRSIEPIEMGPRTFGIGLFSLGIKPGDFPGSSAVRGTREDTLILDNPDQELLTRLEDLALERRIAVCRNMHEGGLQVTKSGDGEVFQARYQDGWGNPRVQRQLKNERGILAELLGFANSLQ